MTLPDYEVEVQEALDDPRVGDVFHEMYSYGVQVMHVTDNHVTWRSFNDKEINRGVETREKWKLAFRYSHDYKHTMRLMERGLPPGA